jgi:dTDP-4-dehydrorhamnose reductase
VREIDVRPPHDGFTVASGGHADFMLELWAGIEPTVNRVGDTYHDQLALSGHERRLEDLDLFADLGVKTVRYPVLWERTTDWAWTD